MKATTIKLEKKLLDQLYDLIPEDQTLSKFVKEIIQKEVNRRKMIKAAHSYNQFLAANKDEAENEDLWESSDLISEPLVNSKKRKK